MKFDVFSHTSGGADVFRPLGPAAAVLFGDMPCDPAVTLSVADSVMRMQQGFLGSLPNLEFGYRLTASAKQKKEPDRSRQEMQNQASSEDQRKRVDDALEGRGDTQPRGDYRVAGVVAMRGFRYAIDDTPPMALPEVDSPDKSKARERGQQPDAKRLAAENIEQLRHRDDGRRNDEKLWRGDKPEADILAGDQHSDEPEGINVRGVGRMPR